jgi:hypothetical protein
MFSFPGACKMEFFVTGSRIEIPELLERSSVYREYLQSIRDRLPLSAFEFATAAWHYDYSDHRCPHDSWVESLAIVEPAGGERLQHRTLHISVRLFGAYHDGHVLLDYSDVNTYSLEKRKTQAAHGDWLVDEIRLSENGLVLHEVVFNSGSRWLIEAADISYEWHQMAV